MLAFIKIEGKAKVLCNDPEMKDELNIILKKAQNIDMVMSSKILPSTVNVFYLATDADIQLLESARSNKVFIVTGNEKFITKSCISLLVDSNKPKIIINATECAAAKVALNPAIFKIASAL